MKQLLLIGDSIRLGYCEHVKELFADKMDVVYPKENCQSSQNIMINISNWANLCDKKNLEVIHFNCGQWDAAHFSKSLESLTSLQEYKRNLYCIVHQLKSFFPEAKLVFATTTPMNPSGTEDCNPRTTEEIIRYNEVALQVMKELDITVNDLFSTAKLWGEEYYIDSVHLTIEGYKLLAKQVFDSVSSL